MQHDPWPEVFRQSIEAPYRPDFEQPLERRGAAIRDGLMAWAMCMGGKVLSTTMPDNFGMLILKLQREAGIDSGRSEAFSAAQKEWLQEWDATRAESLTTT